MHLFLKIFSGMANSVDPGSALFAYVILSDTLVYDISSLALLSMKCSR